jgi:hypothetical protein
MSRVSLSIITPEGVADMRSSFSFTTLRPCGDRAGTLGTSPQGRAPRLAVQNVANRSKVDHQFVLGGPLHRQIRGHFALENAAGINRCPGCPVSPHRDRRRTAHRRRWASAMRALPCLINRNGHERPLSGSLSALADIEHARLARAATPRSSDPLAGC